jgi:WS/DGAT/MGAT family acyltransferase
MANPVWVQVPQVDLDYHLRHVTLPAPGTREQFEACVGQLHSVPLDRAHPLWTVTVIEGRQDGCIGFYTNIHHAVVDGQAGVELMRTLFDLTRRPHRRLPAPKARGRTEQPWAGEVIADGLRHDLEQYWKLVRNLPAMARALARSSDSGARGTARRRPGLGPQTPLNVAIDGGRGFATASIPLAAARGIAAAHDARVNDIVLAVCAGALRRYLGRHGGVPEQPLVAGMPVSLRGPGKVELTTQATMARVDLATDIADPVRRLRAIRDATGAAKETVSRTKSLVPMDFPTIGVPWLLHGLSALYGRPVVANHVPRVVNVVVSNVPGPLRPMYLAGARVLHHWPLSIVGHGLGLNITVESYAGMLEFGVMTARAAVARPRTIADGLVASFEQLQRRSRGK